MVSWPTAFQLVDRATPISMLESAIFAKIDRAGLQKFILALRIDYRILR